jgi:hypothetical protein
VIAAVGKICVAISKNVNRYMVTGEIEAGGSSFYVLNDRFPCNPDQ